MSVCGRPSCDRASFHKVPEECTTSITVEHAKVLARGSGFYYSVVLADEVDRLEAQLESVRAELAATAARIAAWDEVLETCLPALEQQMTPTRPREAGL